jgi:hypothetical protein
MGIRRTIIVPIILAVSTAASILAGSAVPVAAAQASSAQVLAVASHAHPDFVYHG